MMMRQQFIRKDYGSLSPAQTVSVLHSGFIVLTSNQSFLFLFLSLHSSPSLLPPPPPQAALMGGTTMVMALALPEQHCSLVDAYENCRALADAKACCDYALHVGVTWWGPKVHNEMETLVREHGVNSFQMYMAYKRHDDAEGLGAVPVAADL
ncbi:hypothetical protein KUCAC02_019751 [Chaenocephalus aceratus]|uniref:Uncharacterized protein n=1 Tax=Chaenocephalus aceratus TaxID=36190 RepID=A0ACB9VQ23_CHAAC|nr:hypothetical protein KUCAC02_019751 [Chaenocephalus aceratus]